jgi:hypothetical protein
MVKLGQMKTGKYLRSGLTAGLALAVLVGTIPLVRAQSTGADPDEILMTTTSASDKAKTTLEERLAKRKAALATRLTEVQTTRLKARCGRAQTRLGGVNTRAKTAVTNRLTLFGRIQDNLSNLLDRLDGRADTTELAAALQVLDEKITAFETASTDFQQTIGDLVEVDCGDDPAGFKASLETVRTEREAVVAASKAVRTHLVKTVKPILKDIKTSLKAKETE